MPTRFMKAAAAIAFSILYAAAAVAQQKAADIPVETFLKRPENQSMALSPDGELLAAITPLQGRDNLVVVDLKKRTRTIITSFKEFDVIDFRWVNNKRLFFRVADGRDALGQVEYKGAYSIDANGEDLRDLNRVVFGSAQTALVRRPAIVPLRRIDDSDEMYVAMNERRREALDVYVLNMRSGRFRLVTSDAPADTQDWVLDWNDVPRVAVAYDPGSWKQTVWYRDDEKAPWRVLAEWNTTGAPEVIEPLAFTEDGKQLYVTSNVGRDRQAIFKYDPAAKKLGEVVFEHALIDLEGGLVFNRKERRLLGIHYNADKPGVAWVDAELAKLQKQVDVSLPGKVNRLAWGGDTMKRMLIFSYSDVDSGRYYLLNREPLGMEELLPTRPWLKPELMSETQYMPYKARDGLQIPAWVTIPKGSSGKNMPLVLHVHGGPWARGFGWATWGRYVERQFFASRGYVVLEPEPRASTEFGRKHLSAGFKQYGKAMQDDLTDGVMHLVKEGIVDKNRVCIYGGSYGGYAAAWGPIKDPDLYRCAIPWIAVTDLVLRQTATWSDTIGQKRTDFEPFFATRVGSLRTEKEELEKLSPARNAERIKIPMLMAMGELDRRVVIEHGTLMKTAMDKAGVKNEYVIYSGEAHGFNKDEHIFDFFKRVEKFLAENLK